MPRACWDAASTSACAGHALPCTCHLLRLFSDKCRAGCCLQELTNEQCEILDLPYGTKLVGEMDEFMIERLTKKGTYEVCPDAWKC